MRIAINLLSADYGSLAPQRALLFAKAAIDKGHSIAGVFCYQNGVLMANRNNTYIDDELDARSEWKRLAEEQNFPLYVCIASSERRGVVGSEQLLEIEFAVDNLDPLFQVVGLATMHDLNVGAERTVQFR